MGDEEKSIIPADAASIETWGQIVDQIIDQLDGKDLPENVIEGIIYLLAGYSTYETGKMINQSGRDVRRWITKYPIISHILANHRESLIKWRMAQLERQFLGAINKSQEILDIDLDDRTKVNPKILSAMGQHVRYLIGLYAGQKIDVHVTHDINMPTLKGSNDALDYIAQRVAELRESPETEPIEVTYRVVDDKTATGPWFNEKGQPIHGELGILDENDDGYLCHICGKRVKHLKPHINTQHNTNHSEYELAFMLQPGTVSSAR